MSSSIQSDLVPARRKLFAGAIDGTSGSLMVSIADSILHFPMSTFHDLINVAFDPDVPSV